MALYIFGHKVPDLDSIVSAIAMAYLKNKLNVKAIATRQGEVNPESEFVLDRFGFEVPIFMDTFANKDVFLVDFSDLAQAPRDIKQANIIGIADHHKLGDITTSTPLECWIRPVGCTCTVIKEMFDYYKIEIPQNLAAIMLCAILSDTVIFKSPTCTKLDKEIAKQLASIANIDDFMALGMEMFRIKSAIGDTNAFDLLKRDFKEFDMGNKKVGIGQLEVVDGSVFDNIKDDLLIQMKKLEIDGGYDVILLLLTDIIKQGSLVLVVGTYMAEVGYAFDKKIKDNAFWLDGCLSRKKQIVPFLEPIFK